MAGAIAGESDLSAFPNLDDVPLEWLQEEEKVGLDDVPFVWPEEVGEPGELEVRCDSNLSRQNPIPTLSQRGGPQQGFDCEEEMEALKFEKLDMCCDTYITIPVLSDGVPSDSIVEGKEAERTRLRGERERN